MPKDIGYPKSRRKFKGLLPEEYRSMVRTEG